MSERITPSSGPPSGPEAAGMGPQEDLTMSIGNGTRPDLEVTGLVWYVENLRETPEAIMVSLRMENPPQPQPCGFCGVPTTPSQTTHEYRDSSTTRPVIVENIPGYRCELCEQRLDDEVMFCDADVGDIVNRLVHSSSSELRQLLNHQHETISEIRTAA